MIALLAQSRVCPLQAQNQSSRIVVQHITYKIHFFRSIQLFPDFVSTLYILMLHLIKIKQKTFAFNIFQMRGLKSNYSIFSRVF